jgi:hypothetical protein
MKWDKKAENIARKNHKYRFINSVLSEKHTHIPTGVCIEDGYKFYVYKTKIVAKKVK